MTFEFNPGQRRAQDNLYASDKRFCLLYGGSRSGKTFLAIRSILVRALKAPKSKHLVVRQEASAARASIMRGNMATLPTVLRMCWPEATYEPNEQYGYITLSNGSEIWIGGLNDDKAMERILGNEYATIYMNEASECRYAAFTLLRSRLAQVVHTDIKGHPPEPLRQKFLVDLNPTTRAHWTYRLWIDGIDPETDMPVDQASYGAEVINPLDNRANLSGDYLADLHALPERARRRFLEGKYTEDAENALWRRSFFKRVQKLPDFTRIVVAIDPAITTEAGSDETGIIACGIDAAGNGYTLEDASGRYKPEEWARQAVSLFRIWGADRVIGEANQGGDMVEAVLRAHAPEIPYRKVIATRGKVVRAEPVAALYERGKVFHYAGSEFGTLEDQLCFVAGTLIETDKGQRPIEAIRAGDLVLTRAGYRPVEVAGETGIAYSVVDIETTDGRRITCTPSHPIFVRDKFVSAETVRPGDILFGSPNWDATAGQSHGGAGGIIERRRVISSTPKDQCFTERYGWRTWDRYLKAITSTISMGIRAITVWPISNAIPLRPTTASMSQGAGTQTQAYQVAALHLGQTDSLSQVSASIAGLATRHGTPRSLASALNSAANERDQRQRSWSVGADIAGTSLKHETHGESIAVRTVTTRRITPASVYNLSVKDLPEYFANGVLVHNCTVTVGFDRKAAGFSPDRMDALVWAYTDLFPQMTRERVSSGPIKRSVGTLA